MPSSRIAAAVDLARAGGRNALVEIFEYDPAWPAAFETERERLAPLLPAGAQLHHFGSTAVPGLAAKPVIDMIALVDDLDAPIAALVQHGGYRYPQAFNATLTHRRFLCFPTAVHRTHHLHLVDEPGELERRLLFRDRLRADPVLAGEYVALKRLLAERHRDDREAYTEAKGEFVKRHELSGLELRAAVRALARRSPMPSQMDAVVSRARTSLATAGLAVAGEDLTRPWGGFLLISQTDIRRFIQAYFPDTGLQEAGEQMALSPKLLLVAPGRRLSWQYHRRRSEIWRIVEGPVGISRSLTDEQASMRRYSPREVLRLELGERHRLIGLDTWGVVAEIWQHTDVASPSDELDIVRVADDYQRT